MRCGFLPVHKPSGPTSAAVLAGIRRLTGVDRVGHTGTLDPPAEGLLIAALARATVLIPYLSGDKTYLARVRLGQTTDTLDAQGRILSERPVPDLSPAQLETLLKDFRGPVQQVPPAISALSHEGKRFYELARSGQTPPRRPRQVHIHELTLLKLHLPEFLLRVTCSAGTYIRSLAADIGESLGCGAHVAWLQRTMAHGVTLDGALSLSTAETDWARRVLGPDRLLSHLSVLVLGPQETQAVRSGRTLTTSTADQARTDGHLRLTDEQGHLIAIGRRQGGTIRPERVLWPANEELPCEC